MSGKVTLQDVTALLHYLPVNNDYSQLRGLSVGTLRVYSVSKSCCLPARERESERGEGRYVL